MPILPFPYIAQRASQYFHKMSLFTRRSSLRGYSTHGLHYFLKNLGKLPNSVIERMNAQIQAPDKTEYPHADAHMRLLLGLNAKAKKAITPDTMLTARADYHNACVAMQALPDNTNLLITERQIPNADDQPMNVRCYQHTAGNLSEIAMLFFHGGGFCIGDLDTHDEFCRRVCELTGWTVVSVDYRLAPEHCAPTALYDCMAAYHWLTTDTQIEQDWAFSNQRVVLAGDSAGGCLATLVAQQASQPHQPRLPYTPSLDSTLPAPLAQLVLYPVTDIDSTYPSRHSYAEGLPLTQADVDAFNHVYVKCSSISEQSPLVTPMNGDISGICPAHIVVAELDLLRDEGLAYANKLIQAGIPTQTHTVMGAPHAFLHMMSVHAGVGAEVDHLIEAFESFVNDQL